MDESNFVDGAEALVEQATRTIGDLIEEARRSSVTAASAYEVTLPSGTKINIIGRQDARLAQLAPDGTTVEPKSSAKAG